LPFSIARGTLPPASGRELASLKLARRAAFYNVMPTAIE
jgi:hypothetical protein